MFEFFLALFGGIHYGRKIVADRSKAKIYESSYDEQRTRIEQRHTCWKIQVADRALEEDLGLFISDPRNYDAVWEEIRDAYLQMPIHRAYTTILIHEPMVAQYYGKGTYTKKERENIASYNRRRALDIMLARRGKVRYCDASSWSNIDMLDRGDGQHSKIVWDEIFELWIYIRNELHRNGVDARLIFKVGQCGDELRKPVYDADDVEKFRYKAGHLTWLPLTFYDENLQYMRV